VIIIAFTQGLGFIFKPLRQPRVIAEVIGGIILGPTALGRIPGFTQNIFPPASLPFLNLIATIGLVLFLFLVGMEVDVGVVRRAWKAAVLVSAAGLIIPFGAGAGIAAAIYREFVNTEEVTYGHFLLFVGVAGTLCPSHNSSNPTSTYRNRSSPLPQSRSQHSPSSVGS
jgi:Kef-type K+ transport system membrane component KefB